ncbi:hypothetical protein FIfi106_00115 [Erwinia phage FIfi106]|nr:hypothetical protein FIfi106_00115 [Erwinia phage FIfi106]
MKMTDSEHKAVQRLMKDLGFTIMTATKQPVMEWYNGVIDGKEKIVNLWRFNGELQFEVYDNTNKSPTKSTKDLEQSYTIWANGQFIINPKKV